VIVEPYKHLPVSRAAIKGDFPEIVGVEPADNFQSFVDRKLYTHNAGHAVSAYLGYLKGYDFIYQAMEDKQIYDAVKDNVEFFALNKFLPSNTDICLEVSTWGFDRGMTLDDLFEIQERFHKSATGLYGRRYDNNTKLMLSDCYGNLFTMSIYKHSTGIYAKEPLYELSVWSSSGQTNLLSISTKNKVLTRDQIKQLNKLSIKNMKKVKRAIADIYKFVNIKILYILSILKVVTQIQNMK
jgi:hypothetical protein